MSVPAVHWALSQRTGSSSRKAVLKCIAEWMIGEKAVDCYPTVEQIAFETELNRKTVMDATRALEKAGFIKKRRACNKKLQWETHYTLVGYEPSEWIGSRRPECRTFENPNVPKPEGTKNGTFEGTKTGTSVSPKNGSYEGTKNGTRTWIDMEDKESTRTSMRTSSADASASASQTLPADFPDAPFDESLYEEARSMGSEPNVEITIEAPAPAPQKRKAAPRRRPATPCPFDADASIPDEYKAIAEKVGIGNPQQVFSAFVNHALATDRRLTVWPAGFRTWCLNEIKWHPDQKPKITPQSQKTAKDYEWI